MRYYFYSMQHEGCEGFSNGVHKGTVDSLYKSKIKNGSIIFFKEITQREFIAIQNHRDRS